MHPKEFRHQKCTTGRLTSLNLGNSEIIQGVNFDGDRRFRSLIDNPSNYPVLLYPGKDAIDVRRGDVLSSAVGSRKLVVFLIDGTWHCSRKIARESLRLMRLPRLMIQPEAPSRFRIKRQPHSWCLSTIEATHEFFLALEAGGLDVYPDKTRLLDAFNAMQDFQVLQTESARRSPRHVVRGHRVALGATVDAMEA